MPMKKRYQLIRRGERGHQFYCVDSETGKRFSLKTKDRDTAEQIVLAKNQSLRQPALNLQIAKAYLAGTDSGVATRTWQTAIESLIHTKHGANQDRWRLAAKDRALASLLPRVIIETPSELLLNVIEAGTVSTNVFLRRLHNFCVDMNWLPWPLIPKRQWPAVQHKEKRGITLDEHQRILAGERNREWLAYYHALWHIGGAQTDVAQLRAEDIDWQANVLAYRRGKTGAPVQLHFGPQLANLFSDLPGEGFLFPRLAQLKESHRASLFRRRCRLVGVKGVSLHSYRYAWAERAKTAGYPERFAQEALGHNSKAVHRAYAKRALMKLPSLEEYEQRAVV